MITLDHVSKKYKASARPALEDVNVKIDKGKRLPEPLTYVANLRRTTLRRAGTTVAGGCRTCMATDQAVQWPVRVSTKSWQ